MSRKRYKKIFKPSGGLRHKAIIELLLEGKREWFMNKWKSCASGFKDIENRYYSVIMDYKEVEAFVHEWKSNNPNASRKDFALFVKENFIESIGTGMFFLAYDYEDFLNTSTLDMIIEKLHI